MERTAIGGETPLYRYRFGAVEFDEASLVLSVDGQPVALEQRPLQVLAELLRYPDEVVTREELLDSVWAGRPTVDNVVGNALAKLRRALGEAESDRITTLPRVGYRLAGPIERHVVGRKRVTALQLRSGQSVPGREHFRLEAQLNPSRHSEVWLARHAKTREARVYKFSPDGEHLALLKREATVSRVLREALGARDDIARILDWNFETPPFFLECEYGGQDLACWAADGERLAAVPAVLRIALFLQIADAVAAAHGVGVLHKDLKPANVLVAALAAGDGWQVRITDFGSARLLDPARLKELGITLMGLTVTQNLASDPSSGTPLYLAPELLTGQAPTVRSDVYSLGLILYQLVVGDLRRPMTSDWQQDIGDAHLREDIAAATHGNPARRLASVGELTERLRGLDTRRAAALQLRESEARAVVAERLLERSRARRPLVIATIATLGLGLGASLWFYQQSQRSQAEVQRQYRTARAINDFIAQDLIGAANPSVSGRSDVTVLQAAKLALPRIDSAFAEAPETRAVLHRAMLDAFAGLTDSEAAADQARKAIESYAQVVPPDLPGLSEARIGLAYHLAKLGKLDEATQTLDTVEKDLPAFVARNPQTQIRYWEGRSLVKAEQLDVKSAVGLDRKAWALMQTQADASDVFRERIWFNLADSLAMDGQLAESETLLRQLIVQQQRHWGERSAKALFTSVVLANNLMLQDRTTEARAILPGVIDGLNQALGPQHRRTLLAKSVLGYILMREQNFAAALPVFDEVYQAFAASYGATSQGTLAMQGNAAMAQLYSGDPRGAEPRLRTALATAHATFAIDSPQVQMLRYLLADCLLTLRQPREVPPLLDGLTVDALSIALRQASWNGLLAYQAGRLAGLQGDPAKSGRLLDQAQGDLATTGPLWLKTFRGRDGEPGTVAETALKIQP